jgi:hypothetical protein
LIVATIPPRGKGFLGVGVDQDARAVACQFSGNGKVGGESRFAASAFLARKNNGFHISCFLSIVFNR